MALAIIILPMQQYASRILSLWDIKLTFDQNYIATDTAIILQQQRVWRCGYLKLGSLTLSCSSNLIIIGCTTSSCSYRRKLIFPSYTNYKFTTFSEPNFQMWLYKCTYNYQPHLHSPAPRPSSLEFERSLQIHKYFLIVQLIFPIFLLQIFIS